MTTPNDASQAHPTATLLPWYLTGTLKKEERRAVDEHLAGCAACRGELENLTRLRSPLKSALAEEPMPAIEVRRAVMATIHAEHEARQQPHAGAGGGRLSDSLEQWFRNLFAPRWVPALAATLLIGQLVLLLWTAGEQLPLPPNSIVTRAIPSNSVRLALAFQDSVPEAGIRVAILSLKGRLVDGPTPDGVYTIEVPATEAGTLDAHLEALRQQSDVIRRAERLAP